MGQRAARSVRAPGETRALPRGPYDPLAGIGFLVPIGTGVVLVPQRQQRKIIMSTKSKDTKRPTHALWHVEGEGEKARWTRIGAAWIHKDLKGANLKFDLFPTSNAGRVVVREVSDKDDANNSSNGASQGGQR